MSVFAAEPAITVRPRSPRLLPVAVYLAVFAVVAAAACGWKYWRLPSPAPTSAPRATAKILIHRPAFPAATAWQEILSQSKSDVREHLKMTTRRAADGTAVFISLSDLPRETLVPLVNVVATAYVQNCRSLWKAQAERVYVAAEEKARAAQQLVQEADSQLSLLHQRQDARFAMENARPEPPPSSPPTVENPQWTAAARRLADLEERRRMLLLERTSLHPAVQEVEMQIYEARRELAGIPQRFAATSPLPRISVPQPSQWVAAPTAAELAAAQHVVNTRQQELRLAAATANLASIARNEELNIDLEPADALPVPALSVAFPRIGRGELRTALLTAAASVVGLGMISYGASLEPVLTSIGELQAILPVPLVGVVPAVHPGRRLRKSNFGRRLIRVTMILIGAMVLFGAAWLCVCF